MSPATVRATLLTVEPHRLNDELRQAAERLTVIVRSEPFCRGSLGSGGLCWLRGQAVIILDAESSVIEQNHALALALSQLDAESVFMAPAARGAITRASARGRLAAVDALSHAPQEAAAPHPEEPVLLVHPHKPGVRDCRGQKEDEEVTS